jgi:DUF4097 and DUF4098 domain-containing protein YvlB
MKAFAKQTRYVFSGFVSCLAVTFSLSGLWAVPPDSLTQTFEVAPGGVLKVSAELGSVEVTSGSSDQVQIEIVPKGWDLEEMQDDFTISFDQSGNDVLVEIKRKSSHAKWFNFGRKGFVLYATLPFEFNVDLGTSGGSIAVADLKGEVKTTTSGGGLSFGQIEGPIWGRTSGGGIQLSECNGNVDVETSGGGIKIGAVDGTLRAHTSGGSISIESSSGSADLGTSGGSIRIENVAGQLRAKTSGGSIEAALLEQPEGECYLGTSGGSVTVKVASNLRFDVDAKTSGGQVRTELPISVRGTIGKTEVQGELNGGGPKLVLRTSGGDIRIKEGHALQ